MSLRRSPRTTQSSATPNSSRASRSIPVTAGAELASTAGKSSRSERRNLILSRAGAMVQPFVRRVVRTQGGPTATLWGLLRTRPRARRAEQASSRNLILSAPRARAKHFHFAAASAVVVVAGLLLLATPALAAEQPTIENTTTSHITATCATLEAEINPKGAQTTYHFEYLTAEQFHQEGGFSSPNTKKIPEPDQAVGSDEAAHLVHTEVCGLERAGTYNFRAVATNSQSPEEGTPGPKGSFFTPTQPKTRETGSSRALHQLRHPRNRCRHKRKPKPPTTSSTSPQPSPKKTAETSALAPKGPQTSSPRSVPAPSSETANM